MWFKNNHTKQFTWLQLISIFLYISSLLSTHEINVGSQRLHVVTAVKRKLIISIKNWYSRVIRSHATCVKWVIPEKIHLTENNRDLFVVVSVLAWFQARSWTSRHLYLPIVLLKLHFLSTQVCRNSSHQLWCWSYALYIFFFLLLFFEDFFLLFPIFNSWIMKHWSS